MYNKINVKRFAGLNFQVLRVLQNTRASYNGAVQALM